MLPLKITLNLINSHTMTVIYYARHTLSIYSLMPMSHPHPYYYPIKGNINSKSKYQFCQQEGEKLNSYATYNAGAFSSSYHSSTSNHIFPSVMSADPSTI